MGDGEVSSMRDMAAMASRAKANEGGGFSCRRCNCRRFWVVYTRPGDGVIKRVRACASCGYRIATYERELGPMRPGAQGAPSRK